MKSKASIENRIIIEANYLVQHKSTVRAAAKALNVSKSTLHKDVTEGLKMLKKTKLYSQVREILDLNTAERHIRGGQATKRKYTDAK